LPASVAIVACATYDSKEVEDAVLRAIDLLGGIERFLPRGGSVLVKPNLLAPRPREACVATDPEVVRAVVNAAKPLGGKISYGDSPGIGSAERVARVADYVGIPAELVEFTDPVAAPGIRFPKVEIAREIAEADAVINVAKAKTHGQMGMTLAVKNLFGSVVGTRKAKWHMRAGHDRTHFARMIVEVAAASRARLHVLDAVMGMEGNGPGAGTPRPLSFILASADAAALDRVACDVLGVPARTVPILEAARRLGFGETDLARIDLVGDDPARFRIGDFKPATQVGLHRVLPLPRVVFKLLRRLLTARPVFDLDRCRGCGLCVEACPAKCLRMRDGKPVIDPEKCIRCLCCQEACPHGAITVKSGWLARVLG
jgi:uncharacterized protein (DUF362 family)/NAD-dependent dihydropyrimidine dehydrogenase PreA subunit